MMETKYKQCSRGHYYQLSEDECPYCQAEMLRSKQDAQKVYKAIKQCMFGKEMSALQVKEHMLEQGMSVGKELDEMIDFCEEGKKASNRIIRQGAAGFFCFVVGIAVTFLSGERVVAYGAIIVGFTMCIKCLIAKQKLNRILDNPFKD